MLALLAACGGPTEAPTPAAIAKFRDVSSGLAVADADSIAVKVTDKSGKAFSGAAVVFTVTAGNGSLSSATVTTGADGIAAVRWTLGTATGTQSATATASLTGSPVLFTTDARAGTAAAVTKVGAEPATTDAASAIDSARVVVTDRFGNTRAGVAVSFAVTAGGGTVAPATVVTTADGRAATRWTVGNAANIANSMTATIPSLPAITFATTTIVGPAALIAKVGADPASIAAGSGYDSLRVLVTDRGGNPKAGTLVTFTGTSTLGSATTVDVTTGSDGRAAVRWTVGTVAGPSANASAAVVGVAAVNFTTTIVAGPAASIAKIGPDPASLSPSSVIDSLRVVVTDEFGNPRSGEVVRFAVVAGGGTVSPATATTNAAGRAATRWTLGAGVLQTNSVTATVGALSALTFTTTTTAAPSTITLSGAPIVVVDVGASIPLTFVPRDGGGNVMTGVQLTAVSRTAAATYSNGNVTGVNAGQTFVIVSTPSNPLAKDSALVIVKRPTAPLLTTDLAAFNFSPNALVTVNVIVDMRTSTDRLGAATVLVTWNPTFLTFISSAEGTSAVGSQVNAVDAATGSFTMTFANSSGFNGAVSLRQLTFRTASAIGAAGTITLFPIDLRASTSFRDLLPSTVSAFFPLVIR